MSNGSAVGMFLLSLCVWIFIIRWIIAAAKRGKGAVPRKSTGTTPGTGPHYTSSPGGDSSGTWYDIGFFDTGQTHSTGHTHDTGQTHDTGYSDPGHYHH